MDSIKTIDFSRLLSTAKQHLIQHEYKTVISTCVYGLEMLQTAEDLTDINEDSEEQRLKVAFGILAIQALALDGRRNQVDTFVEQWFGEVRALPAEILQLCVCLHLHTIDYQLAQNITEEWLEDKMNHNRQGYELVVELYIKNILLPQKQTEKAKNVLEEFENITEKRKQSLLLSIERSQEISTADVVLSRNSSTSSCHSDVQKSKVTGTPFSLLLRVIKLCATTKQVLGSMSVKSTLKTGARFVILFCFLYAIIARTSMPGDIFNKGSGPNHVWDAVKQAWRALFAPYHMMPQ